MKVIRVIGVVISLLLSMTVSAGNCDLCDHSLSGRYYTFAQSNGKTMNVCQNCIDAHGRCAYCNVPVKGTRPGSAHILCDTCKSRAIRCDVCGDLIVDSYVVTPIGHHYCRKCESGADRCASCNDLLRPGEWRMDHGLSMCSSCLTNNPRCLGCQTPLFGSFTTFLGYKGGFCSKCVANTPKCVSCGRPCGDYPHQLDNGNVLCSACIQTAVLTSSQLIALAKEIRQHLDTSLFMPIDHQISWELVDSLNETGDENTRESGRFIVQNDTYRIQILKGLARSVCMETIAHELGHAWQTENMPNIRDDTMREGFAEWVASKVLIDYSLDHLLEKMAARDDIYGEGYRWMIALEKKNGTAGLFKKLRAS